MYFVFLRAINNQSKNKVIKAVYLEISKGIDTLSHEILVKNLTAKGVDLNFV